MTFLLAIFVMIGLGIIFIPIAFAFLYLIEKIIDYFF